jgi:tungstate transport system substrate-binding protein
MLRHNLCLACVAAFFALSAFGPHSADAQTPAVSTTVRCAVVGGLNEIDFWNELADRFHRLTGNKLEIAATGPRHVVIAAFKAREADVIVMHASDAMINLVADGLGKDPQPWARNDYLIVGPPADPAKIKGERDAVAALKKIISARAKLLIHASSGVSELLGELLAVGELELDPQATIYAPGDRHRQLLARAAEEQAYTLVGRIPFLSGKLDRGELQIMVQGDERLHRPYLVVTTTDRSTVREGAARLFAQFLRQSDTQQFIAAYGKGRYDDEPLLFPVKVSY